MVLHDISLTLSVSVVATVSLSFGLVLVLLVCLNCFRKTNGFTNFGNNSATLGNDQGHINNSFVLNVDDTNGDLSRSSAVTIEPLPDVTSKLKLSSTPLRPRISCLGKARQDASLKLIAVHRPFPRNQIIYLKELGSGWFGKAIESDAEKINTGIARSKVVVKMLKDDASREERNLFFEEVAPFRELEHNNIIHLLGQCTETTPLLMIMESAAYGSLKQYLSSHRHSEALLIQKNRLMQFAVDASCGLACLHRHDYLHRDLAARNCLVMSDYTLKIGDYGIADHLFKEDYFTSGTDLLPIRWMAPETLKLENGIWTSHNFSKDSDIWSLGVVLWEIATMGEQPYGVLTDEEVLQRVVVDKDVHLLQPYLNMPNKDQLYELMRFCWLDHTQRVSVDEVYGLLQQINNESTGEAASSDTTSAFDEKWSQLMPNQHHRSADSIDSQLASASRGDANLPADLSQQDSVEDLTAPDLPRNTSHDTQAIVHASVGDGFALDTQNWPHSSISQTGTADAKDDISPLSALAAADVSIPATFHTDSSALPSSVAGTRIKANDFVLVNDQIVNSPTESLDLSIAKQLPSCDFENSSLGFDVLEPTHDFDLAENKSLSDSTGTGQASTTSSDSVHRDSSSCDFVMVPDPKISSDLSVFDGSAPSVAQSEYVSPTDCSPDSVSQSHDEKMPPGIEISSSQDHLVSFGTELFSLSSLTVQIPSLESDRELAFPSLNTDLSSLSSLKPQPLEPHTTSDTSNESLSFHLLGNNTSPSAEDTESSSSQQNLDDFHFDTMSSLPDTGSRMSNTGRLELPVQNEGTAPVAIKVLNVSSSPTEKIFAEDQSTECVADSADSGKQTVKSLAKDELTECVADSSADREKQTVTQQSPATGLDSEKSVSNVNSSVHVTRSKGRGYIPKLISTPSALSDVGVHNGLSLPAATSEDTQDSSMIHSRDAKMPQDLVWTSGAGSDEDCMGATGGLNEEDTDSSSNSDSGKDYVCDETWEAQGTSSPLSCSPTSSVDSEEYALQIASEIYLSKGLKMGRPFESTFLEPIPEDPIPSVSEESVAPTPSETSSVDVKFDEVFEWDDFMGEPLVGKDRSSPEGGSLRESFDMSDWTLEIESDSLPSASNSLHTQHSDTFRKESSASDIHSPGSPSTIDSTRSSLSDSELTSHVRSRNHRSYISDLLSNRTKGISTSAHSYGQSKFYSLYEEEFDLESDSQSEGGESPPVHSFLSESQDSQEKAGGASPLYAEPHSSSLQGAVDDSVPSDTQGEGDAEMPGESDA